MHAYIYMHVLHEVIAEIAMQRHFADDLLIVKHHKDKKLLNT